MISKNLYTKELKRNRKNLAIWTAIVIGFTLMVVSIYPYMAELGEGLTVMMEKIPPEMAKALGMDTDTWSNILGFYSTYYGVYIIVLISIFAGSTATNILSKEEQHHTAEFLMTRPMSRSTIFWTKISSLFTLCFAIYLIQSVLAIIGITIFSINPIDWSIFIRLHLAGLFLMIFFTSISLLISMYVSPKKNLMGLVVGLTFGTYLINALGKSTEKTEWLSYFSPFNYFNLTIGQPEESFRIISAIILLTFSAITIFMAYQKFNKKDFIS